MVGRMRALLIAAAVLVAGPAAANPLDLVTKIIGGAAAGVGVAIAAPALLLTGQNPIRQWQEIMSDAPPAEPGSTAFYPGQAQTLPDAQPSPPASYFISGNHAYGSDGSTYSQYGSVGVYSGANGQTGTCVRTMQTLSCN